MNKVDFLIVGGSAAGTTAAETIRGILSDSSVAIVTDEDHEQYSRVLLPNYVRHQISREQMFLKKPEWYEEKKIELIRGVRAQRLDVSKKIVTLSNDEEIEYGKLLITVGGYVIPLDIPGADSDQVLYMRTVEDGEKIIEKSKGARRAVIIGGGFIGLEFSSCFRMNGIEEVTTLVRGKYYWSKKLDEVSSRVIVGVLGKNGVSVKTEEEPDHLESEGGKLTAVVTKSGNRYEADVVGVGIGIKSDFSWLSGSGVEIGGGIVTNEYLETSISGVYAAGDCAEFYDPVFERRHLVGNWTNATTQGSAVGKTMSHSASSGQAGQRTRFETVSSYSINFFTPPNNGSCTFIGVTDLDFADHVVVRGSAEAGKVTRIFIKKYPSTGSGQVTRIVGATVVNNPVDVGPITIAVKNRIDVAKYVGDIDRLDFDLKSLIK